VVLLLPLAVWLLASLVAVYAMTRRPRPHFDEPVPVVDWARFEPLRIATPDGEELGAWIAEGEPDAPSVLILHGYRGSRRNCLPYAELIASTHASALLVSLRAHGDSTGRRHDVGYSARHDVVAAVEYLERRRPGRPILVFGCSMGAAAAIFASNELGSRVHGYILESPYKDLRTAVWNRTENELPPILNAVAYYGLALVAPLFLPQLDRIAPIRAVERIPTDVPVLIMAGGNDRRARPHEARAIFERIESHATLVMFHGAEHSRLLESDRDRFRSLVQDFVLAARRRMAVESVSSTEPVSAEPAHRKPVLRGTE
jgi:alpha-beta hydrolase superfamily lysophospholipase